MMLKADEVIKILDNHCQKVDQIQNWRRYECNGVKVCVDIERSTVPAVVIEPALAERLDEAPLAGIVVRSIIHSTNLKGFPKRQNGGLNTISYGYRVSVATPASMLSLVGIGVPASIDPPKLVPGAIADAIKATQALVTAKQRIGQGKFREDLEERWDSACAVTGLDIRVLLRASHIKPWYLSSDAERVTVHNGLLLNVLLDAAFDAGLVSIDDNGQVLVAEIPGSDMWMSLGLSPEARLRKPLTNQEREFLTFHRASRFIGDRNEEHNLGDK
jgi:putative restriction endonuclease